MRRVVLRLLGCHHRPGGGLVTNRDGSAVAEVFGTVRRFHVYDHGRDEWAMSGADFGHSVAVDVLDEPDGDLSKLSSPPDTSDEEGLTLVWEDGAESDVEEMRIGKEMAGGAADLVIEAVSDELEVDVSRVRLVSLEAPDVAKYIQTADPGGLEKDGGR